MIPGQILSDAETFARCAIHPRYTTQEMFAAGLFEFKKVKGTSGTYVSSVGWRERLATIEDVHSYGCRTAATSNTAAMKKGEVLVPLENMRHYMGCYELDVGGCRKHENEVYDIVVQHYPENGEDAHCHLTMREKSHLSKEQQKLKSAFRTNVITGLWEDVCRGPLSHVCECDQDHAALLKSRPLPLAPNGEPQTAGGLRHRIRQLVDRLRRWIA